MRIIVDERERGSRVPSHLRALGVRVLFKRLTVGDYILSSDCAVERKTARDFVNSVSSGRIFDQARRLAESYSRPTLIIEGDVRIAISTLRAGLRSFYGALAFLWMAYSVATFFSSSERETAELLYALVKHEQVEVKKRIVIREKPKLETLRERQLFVVQSFPGIGPKLADRLLRRFGSIKRIVNASPIELSLVEGLGRKKGFELVRFFEAKYD
ncbi:MAG: hypothetical protein DRJ26_02260, partial [Candidatus Methanomethylicota archaeon]